MTYTPMMSVRSVSQELGATEARLEELLRTSGSWSADLDIPMMSPEAASHARRILALIDETFKNDSLRIFPSEHAGVAIQRRGRTITRIVEVDPSGMMAATHDRHARRHHSYSLRDDQAAAAFLTAS